MLPVSKGLLKLCDMLLQLRVTLLPCYQISSFCLRRLGSDLNIIMITQSVQACIPVPSEASFLLAVELYLLVRSSP